MPVVTATFLSSAETLVRSNSGGGNCFNHGLQSVKKVPYQHSSCHQPSSSPNVSLCSTSIESPTTTKQHKIPLAYRAFQDVFSKQLATTLPPHKPWDCAIDLLPGATLPHGKICTLSIPEQKTMEEYIEEALQQKFIRPSTSPAASSFFFVAHIFMKLDLRSTYNLVRIRKGYEWKTGFGYPVAVKFVRKTPDSKYISTPFHPEPLPLEIALAVISNRGPSCPNIIQMLDWQDDPEHYVMIMELLLPSMDMHTFLKLNGGILKEPTAQQIMRQVIMPLAFAVIGGVFHGDIKLTNLLTNLSTLEVKLIDFGCGDLLRDSAYMSLRGTKPYIPPEYYDTGKYHAKLATVFPLGISFRETRGKETWSWVEPAVTKETWSARKETLSRVKPATTKETGDWAEPVVTKETGDWMGPAETEQV
ncbi:unnamed protein product [Leuciscus chuanchicus]